MNECSRGESGHTGAEAFSWTGLLDLALWLWHRWTRLQPGATKVSGKLLVAPLTHCSHILLSPRILFLPVPSPACMKTYDTLYNTECLSECQACQGIPVFPDRFAYAKETRLNLSIQILYALVSYDHTIIRERDRHPRLHHYEIPTLKSSSSIFPFQIAKMCRNYTVASTALHRYHCPPRRHQSYLSLFVCSFSHHVPFSLSHRDLQALLYSI